jgi:hypothetical protein
LPERYREKTVYLRRVPHVPARWFGEVHLLIMRELLVTPACFDLLLERTGLETADLAHHLAVLYHAGGLTTDADSARRAEPAARRAMTALQFDQSDHESDLRSRVGLTEQMPPSSILREAPHSPLRVSTASTASKGESPPPVRP